MVVWSVQRWTSSKAGRARQRSMPRWR
uniref:Uncharacterized protein n=1 Tax=Arundo donax TaxID=35708 RepID=A0A0A9H4E0_ARUDO